jgi:hypothetical protein
VRISGTLLGSIRRSLCGGSSVDPRQEMALLCRDCGIIGPNTAPTTTRIAAKTRHERNTRMAAHADPPTDSLDAWFRPSDRCDKTNPCSTRGAVVALQWSPLPSDRCDEATIPICEPLPFSGSGHHCLVIRCNWQRGWPSGTQFGCSDPLDKDQCDHLLSDCGQHCYASSATPSPERPRSVTSRCSTSRS